MQALLLAGGRGNRADDLTKDKNKCMIPVQGKPVIWHNLHHLASAGVEETVVVVGYKAEDIINEFGITFEGMRIKYVIQLEQKGVIHAIECALHEIKGDFVMGMADEVHVDPDLRGMLAVFRREDVMAICGVVKEENRERIKQTYSVIPIGKRIIRLIEKPQAPMNDLMGTGICAFKQEMVDHLSRTPINPYRGEREMPDWIQCVIDVGGVVEYYIISREYVNINFQRDIEMASSLLEKSQTPQRSVLEG